MLESTYAAGNDWQYFSEQAADVNCKYNRTAKGLIEQLNLTDNDSDYLWYVLRTSANVINELKLQITS